MDRVVGLFLMWYGFILCWIFPMYYRSLRSRVLIEQSLWIEVLSSVYLLNALRGLFEKIKRNKKSDKRIEGKEVKVEYFMKSWRNKIVNQKKFYGVYSGEMDEVLDVKKWGMSWIFGMEELLLSLRIAKKIKMEMKKVIKRNYSKKKIF